MYLKHQYLSMNKNDDDEITQEENQKKNNRCIKLSHVFAAYATFHNIVNQQLHQSHPTNTSGALQIVASDRKLMHKMLLQYFELYNRDLLFNTIIDKAQINLPTKQYQRINDVNKLEYVYLQILTDDEFRNKIAHQVNFMHTIENNIILKDNSIRLGELTFQYNGDKCMNCNEELERSNISFGTSANAEHRKGKIAVAYPDVGPPKICVSYIKQCDKCNIMYSYGIKRNIETGYIERLPLNDKDYFEVTTYTYIHKQLFKSITDHVFGSAIPLCEYVDLYNKRFCDYIDNIYQQSPSIGKRQGPISLNYNRVKDSFWMYCLQRYVQEYINKNISLTKKERKEIIKQKNMITAILRDPNSNKNSDDNDSPTKNKNTKEASFENNMSLSSKEEFQFLWRKYRDELEEAKVPCIDKVPVKKDKKGDIFYHPGHFIGYGDGNEGSKRWSCPTSPSIIQYCHLKSGVKHEQLYDRRYMVKNHYYHCECSIIRGTGEHKSCVLCLRHTTFLMKEFNMQKNEINQFILWYKISDNIEKLQNDKTLTDEDKKVKHVLKMSKLENLLAQIEKKETNIENWKQFRKNIYKTIQQSSLNDMNKNRKCKQKTKANIHECIEMIKDTECLENHDVILGEMNECEMLNDILPENRDELNRDILLDEILSNSGKGCRKESNIIPAASAQTKGVNGWFTCSGFCIKLREEIYKETATQIVIETAKAFTCHSSIRKYFDRLTAIGYDMMCNVNSTFRSLFKNNSLNESENKFWLQLQDRSFIDIWHISTHKNNLCQPDQKTGIFHPKLKKFRNVLHNIDSNMKINHQVVEQFWKLLNQYRYTRSLSAEKFQFFLLLKREYHNEQRIIQLENEGWKFIDINNISPLRQYKDLKVSPTLPQIKELITNNQTPLQTPHFTIIPQLEQNENHQNANIISTSSKSLSQSSISSSQCESDIHQHHEQSKRKKRYTKKRRLSNAKYPSPKKQKTI